jgi:hypothetical protein
MANQMTTTQGIVTATAVAQLLLAANAGASRRMVALPVAGTLWVGGPGVTTTGAGRGFPVVLNQPYDQWGSGDPSGAGIYQGALYGVATAICTATVVEVFS